MIEIVRRDLTMLEFLNRMSGWIRLYIVFILTCMFVGVAGAYVEISRIDEDTAQHMSEHRPEYFSALPRDLRKLLALNDSTPESEYSFPILMDRKVESQYLKDGTTGRQREDVWRAYERIADLGYREEKRLSILKEWIVKIIAACLLAGFFGCGVLWVRNGFAKKNLTSQDA